MSTKQSYQKENKINYDLLFESHTKAMYNLCLRMMQQREEAEDSLQEAFYIAYRSINKLEKKELFTAWLKRIVVNQCLQKLRKKKEIWQDIDSVQVTEQEEESNWMHSLTFEDINRAIVLLPEGCRQILVLYLLEGYKHHEISEFLNISVSTSKSQYHRGKKLLQKELKKVHCYG